MSEVSNFVNKTVSVVTNDGKFIIGTLKGFDQALNIILEDSFERIFSEDEAMEQVVLGLYLVRGDNVAVIAEVDDEAEARIDWSKVRAPPLNPVVH